MANFSYFVELWISQSLTPFGCNCSRNFVPIVYNYQNNETGLNIEDDNSPIEGIVSDGTMINVTSDQGGPPSLEDQTTAPLDQRFH